MAENSIIELIREYWLILNEIFLSTAAKGNFPTLSPFDFNHFARLANLPDKKLTMAVIDMYFVATNVEIGEEQEGNDDRSLCRFEFWEMLIRIAKGKFLETKKETNIVSAFERILKEHVLPTFDHCLPGQRFRDDFLWTLRVNDVLERNEIAIARLYKKGV